MTELQPVADDLPCGCEYNAHHIAQRCACDWCQRWRCCECERKGRNGSAELPARASQEPSQ